MPRKIDRVIEWDPELVPENAVKEHEALLRSKPFGCAFQCTNCGKLGRTVDVIRVDGAFPLDKTRECIYCGAASGVLLSMIRPVKYVPGSFVLAPLKNDNSSYAPAIVENSPETESEYCIVRLDPLTGRDEKIFYVTFILRDQRNKGGWFNERNLFPLTFPVRLVPSLLKNSIGFAQAFKQCLRLKNASLKRRLRKLSFLAHVKAKRMKRETSFATQTGSKPEGLPMDATDEPRPEESQKDLLEEGSMSASESLLSSEDVPRPIGCIICEPYAVVSGNHADYAPADNLNARNDVGVNIQPPMSEQRRVPPPTGPPTMTGFTRSADHLKIDKHLLTGISQQLLRAAEDMRKICGQGPSATSDEDE